MTEKRLTAQQAVELSQAKDPAYAVETILRQIRTAAQAGAYSIKTGAFGFGGHEVHCSEENWPALNQSIVKELRELGYRAEVRVEYRQFADIWLQVNWGAVT